MSTQFGVPIFEQTYHKLSDLMIPVQTFCNMVRAIEGYRGYSVQFNYKHKENGEIVAANNDLMMMPYPFIKPISDEYSDPSMDLNSISPEDYESWRKVIEERTETFVRFALPRYVVTELDNNPDVCIIVHVYSGYIVPISRSCVDDLTIVAMPVLLADLLKNIKTYTNQDLRYNNMYQAMKANAFQTFYNSDQYTMTYDITYKQQDRYNQSGGHISGTPSSATMLTLQNSKILSDHIVREFHQGKKIILTI